MLRVVSEERALKIGEHVGVEKIYHIGRLGYVRFELFPEKAMFIHPVLNKFTVSNFRIFKKVCIELGFELAEYYGFAYVSALTDNTKLVHLYGEGIVQRLVAEDGSPVYVVKVEEARKKWHQ